MESACHLAFYLQIELYRPPQIQRQDRRLSVLFRLHQKYQLLRDENFYEIRAQVRLLFLLLFFAFVTQN